MNDITRYFDRIDSLIRHSFCVNDQVTYQLWTQSAGAIEGVLHFYDSSRLEFTEIVRLTERKLYKQRYRYQYVLHDQQRFRYDNAPHHLHLSTFPHHKHDERGQIVAAEEVSLAEVL
ncbi:MAG: hypothetical protein KDE31_37960, partial [Caldilineaceae bacterium]|nr:hypothetical protein [Caldilineaceae bacterium]